MPHLLAAALLVALAVNAWTLYLFRLDKQRARAGRRRVPETELLLLALAGGSPGALIARRLFRHKTRKQPFSAWLMLIVAVQALALAAAAWLICRR